MSSFVYCWENLSNSKRYIGCHKGQTDDGYICSSKYMMEDYSKDASTFARQILGVFDTYRAAREWEMKLLKKVDAENNPKFYNRSNGFKAGHHSFYWRINTPGVEKTVCVRNMSVFCKWAGLSQVMLYHVTKNPQCKTYDRFGRELKCEKRNYYEDYPDKPTDELFWRE